MKYLSTVMITLCLPITAADKPAVKLTEVQQLKAQNIGYQQMVAKLQQDVADRDKTIAQLREQILKAAQDSLVSDICGEAGFAVEGCSVNPSDSTVTGTKRADNKVKPKEGQ